MSIYKDTITNIGGDMWISRNKSLYMCFLKKYVP